MPNIIILTLLLSVGQQIKWKFHLDSIDENKDKDDLREVRWALGQ